MVELLKVFERHGGEVYDIYGHFLRRVACGQIADHALKDICLSALGRADDHQVGAGDINAVYPLVLVVRVIENTDGNVDAFLPAAGKLSGKINHMGQ